MISSSSHTRCTTQHTTRSAKVALLMLPLLMPVLSGAVRATSELLTTGQLPFEPVQLLLVTDATYLIVSFLGFEYVLDD